MATWKLVFQQDDLPTSVGNADGGNDGPPSELIRYIENRHGAWTMAAPTRPLAVELIDFPRNCPRSRCSGSMEYLAPVPPQEEHRWRCPVCGSTTDEWGGFAESIGLGR